MHVRSIRKYATLIELTHDSLLKIRRKPERGKPAPPYCFEF